MTASFELFPLLPKDLRFMIWERTFTLRILSFTYDDERNTDQGEWPEDWDEVAIDRLFALPDSTIQPDFDLPGPLSVMITEMIPALEACRESREMTVRAGYREWTQIVPSGKISFYWNPVYDTVSLLEFYDSQRRQPFCVLIDTFCNQFPEQARELLYLAVPTSLWNHPDGGRGNGKMAEKLIRFQNVKEIPVIVDNVYEAYRLEEIQLNHSGRADGCVFPDAIAKGWEEVKASSGEKLFGWKIPHVRLVTDEESVLSYESIRVKLRCSHDDFNDLVAYKSTE